jgi:outer membrane protein, heavy metal efflux system
VGAPKQLQLQGKHQQAGAAVAWSLDQVEATTFSYNPILRRSIARIESARGDAQQAGLYPNPSFDTNNPEVFAGPATQYNVGFQQTIVVKGKLRLDRAAANEVVRQKEHGLTQDRFSLLLAVRQQFYTVLAAQRRNEMLGQIREIAAASVRAAQQRFDAGEGTLSEVLLLQTELARTEIALQTAQTMLIAERRQLSAIMGRPDLNIEQVTGQLTFGFPNFDENMLREFVVSQNAQVQIARREIERNQILLRRARVEPYPNLHGGPAYANNLNSSPGSQQFWLNIQFDMPLWNRNQGNIRSTEGDLADAIASLGVLQNDLLRQVEEVLGRYRAARQSEERIRTQVLPTATRAQQLVKDGFQKGILDVSTFLQAQRALSDATLSYIDALENVWTTGAEIASLLQLDRFP